ncbi:V-set domain-containing T-cell activation inhibitor 1 [Solea senegalensis]|uniref:V-set domain-containing T-cell activation inhibitor 1 n=1 Tax=Solea senegalensis TaxID=28829 RepID=A0AAV6RC48_SOLSE|nr:V-set domain-containing T-cell activation inhibitor 1 [Solea senegalensis]KAG7502050.1 V-set domain-containing T-cell activation inhibitor 1 [Solea senegalensis]
MGILSRIIFCSMIILIILFAFAIILILSLAFSKTAFGVLSTNTAPVGNLGEDQLLSCYLPIPTVSQVSVSWEKSGIIGFVYQHTNGAASFKNQNPQFKGRTELFPNDLVTGNASLMLRNVRLSDEGEYYCTISSSQGGGRITISLRTAAYTAPTFTLTNNVLAAEASRWFPEPNVTWFSLEQEVLQGDTTFSQSSFGIYSITSKLQPVNKSGSYMLKIENDLVTSVSTARLTETEISKFSYFAFSVASSLLPSPHLRIMISVLCVFYVT